MSENLLENISSGIWRQICRRFILETNPKETSPHNYRNGTGEKATTSEPGREFVYHDTRLDGVIAHFTRECSGNIHDKEIVNVTASSVYHNSGQPKNAVDLGTNSRYGSNDERDTWILPGIEFVYDSSKPLEGIIAHLTRECGGNVHDKGIVNIWGN